jgi:hypothetical protein
MSVPGIRTRNHKKTPVQAAYGGSTHYHVGGVVDAESPSRGNINRV